MRRRPRTILALAAVIAVGGVVAAAPSASLAAEKGLSVDLTWGTSSSDQNTTASMLPATGAKWVRLTFDWSQLETSKGSYSSSWLSTYDRAVTLSRQAGMNIDVTVYNTPKWASANGQTSGPPANDADYANFMTFLANRYRGQVQAWEIWNEENTSRFWSTGPDAAAYTGLLRAAYPAVKAADPNAIVVFGGTFGNDTGFISGAYQAGAKGYFDVMAVHPYSGNQPPEHPWFSGYRNVRSLMLAWGDDKPMWLTEFGWSTCSASNCVGYESAGEATQADYITRAYRMIEQDPYVQVAIYYNFRNNFWNHDADGWDYQLGLLYTNFSPKLAYTAFKNYVPGQYVPPATSSGTPPSGTPPATSSSTRTSDGRARTSTSLQVLRSPRTARAARGVLRVLRIKGVVRGAHSGRVTLQLSPLGRPVRGLTALTRNGVVGRSGAFQVTIRVRPGRWRIRGVFSGNSRARPSRSPYVYFRA